MALEYANFESSSKCQSCRYGTGIMEWNQVKLNLIEIIPRFSDYSTTAVKIVAAVDSELDGSSQPFLVKKKNTNETTNSFCVYLCCRLEKVTAAQRGQNNNTVVYSTVTQRAHYRFPLAAPH